MSTTTSLPNTFDRFSDPDLCEPAYAASPSTTTFDPPPGITEQILTDIAHSNVPLLVIAERARTSLHTLHLWLARPDISNQLDDIELTLRRRSRLKAFHELDNITEACATILERFHRAPDRGSTIDQRPDTELRASSIITRNASNVLMASRVLLALARYLDGPPRSQHRSPGPAAPKTNPAADLDPGSLNPREQSKAFRLLPSLASIDLHDFREYLTSNHHTPSDAGDEALRIPGWTHNSAPRNGAGVPRHVAVPPQQPVPTTSDLTTSPNSANSSLEPEGLTRNSRGQSAVGRRPTSAAHGTDREELPHPEGVQRKSLDNCAPSQTCLPPRQRDDPQPCTCGPTRCPTCRSTPTLLTIAGTQTPRARDPTAGP